VERGGRVERGGEGWRGGRGEGWRGEEKLKGGRILFSLLGFLQKASTSAGLSATIMQEAELRHHQEAAHSPSVSTAAAKKILVLPKVRSQTKE
jgi:hypothetical protein